MARRTRYDFRNYVPMPTERCGATNKIIYPSAPAAESAAAHVKLEYGSEVDAYQDPQCGHWHLTSSGR